MLVLLLGACLIDAATYERRLEELTDHDGDGVVLEDDCDDADAAVHPGADERCNGVDDNCDGEADEGFAGRSETCDGVDEDCDGVVDEDPTDGTLWYGDADRDGYGLAEVVVVSCEPPPGTSSVGTDCDDASASRYPGATEVPYDGIDQDCSGFDLTDVDLDGYPAAEAGGDDCDDNDAAIHPGASETWEDGFTDNDCDPENEGAVEEYGTSVFTGRIAGSRAGGNLAGVGDLDGDGFSSFAVAAFYDGTRAPYAGAVFLVDSATPAPLSEFTSLESDESWAFLGVAIDSADIDGDGVAELLLGATGSAEGRGAVHLLRASDLKWGAANLVESLSATGVVGPHPEAYLGSQARVLPDWDGDGLMEVAASAPLADAQAFDQAGAVYVFDSGELMVAEASVPSDEAEVVFTGNGPGDAFGNGLLPAGDQDGDGLEDLIVYDGYNELWLIPGGATSSPVEDAAIAKALDAVADSRLLDDVDGDGRPDVLILGSTAYVIADFSAKGTWVPNDAYSRIETDGNYVSEAINLGDRDGDGRGETLMLLMDRSDLGTGWAGVVAGDTWGFGAEIDLFDASLQALATRPGSAFGYRAAEVGVLDASGQGYFAVGGWLDDEGGVDAGAVALLANPR